MTMRSLGRMFFVIEKEKEGGLSVQGWVQTDK